MPQVHKKTGYGQGRTLLHNMGDGDWNQKAEVMLKYLEKIDWGDLPDEIVERFQSLSRSAMKRFARRPSRYGKGTYERVVTYRIRQAFRIKFDEQGGFSFFHPQDDNDSTLGVFMSRQRESETDETDWEECE